MIKTMIGALLIAAAALFTSAACGADASPPEANGTTGEAATTAPAENAAESAPGAVDPQNAEQAPARPPSTGSLRETVTETMRTFTPSEAIDVDKPVDFPANI